MENRLVFCQFPRVEADSTRISGVPDVDYTVYEESVTSMVNFLEADSLDGVVDMLSALDSWNVHLMGTRGYVYHTGILAEYLQNVIDGKFPMYYPTFPRVCNLRKAILTFIK